MESKRDDAIRAKEISERHFEAKDYLGAKRFAQKAQTLYPCLDGIQRMLATIDVYISSENRINGVTDWYRVLDINPKADEDTIKKQYRKLALVLHPDKNKSIGANGAFTLITEASKLLLDKVKRLEYDQNRSLKKGARKANPQTCAKRKSTAAKSSATAPPYQPNYPISLTFWTVCHRCKLQHEYQRIYLHRNLACPNCNKPYYAFEYPPPSFHFPKMTPQSYFFPQTQPETVPGVSGSSPSLKGEKSMKEREADLKRETSGLDLKATKKRKVVEDPAETRSSYEKEKKSKGKINYEISDMVWAETAREKIRKTINEWKRETLQVIPGADITNLI